MAVSERCSTLSGSGLSEEARKFRIIDCKFNVAIINGGPSLTLLKISYKVLVGVYNNACE
jgi:hypothetical protein